MNGQVPVNYSNYKISDLKSALDDKGILYKSNFTKPTLIKLLEEG